MQTSIAYGRFNSWYSAPVIALFQPGHFIFSQYQILPELCILLLMSAIFDYIVSETWSFMTVFILLCAVPTVMIMWSPFRNIVAKRITQILVSLIAIGALMYLLFSDHGYAVNFIQGLSNGKEICLIEKHYQGDGDGGSYEVYRMYVIDAATGNLMLRQNVESPELLCLTETEAIFFERSGAVAYDLLSGKKTRSWSPESGFENYPELASGVNDLNRSSEIWRGENEAWLTITANNGHHFVLNLVTEELIEAEYPPNANVSYSFQDYQLSYQDARSQEQIYISFKTKTGDIETLSKSGNKGSSVDRPEEFLHADFVSVDWEKQIFVIRHSETLDDRVRIFSAYDFDLNLLWQKNQDELIGQYDRMEAPHEGMALAVNDYFILTLSGTVSAVDQQTGALIWHVYF